MTLTDEERSCVFSLVMDIYQNYNTRSAEPVGLLESILHKLGANAIDFSEQETRRVQFLMQDKLELFSRIADVRLQHILCGQNNQGFGRDHGNKENFFNGPKMYQLCQAVLKKLEVGP